MAPETSLTNPNSVKQNKGHIKSSRLLLFSFATAFLSRVLDTLGAPSFINLAHFGTIPFAVGVALLTTRTKDRKQIIVCQELLFSLGILLSIELASAIFNDAGLINVILSFLLLAEPFLLLLGLVCIPVSQDGFNEFKEWVFKFIYFNITLSLIQKILVDVGILKATTMSVPADNIQGVFYLSGSGHVVSASVSISFGLYYFLSEKNRPLWMRAGVFFAAFMQLLFADAKQVLLVGLVSWLLLIVINLDDIKATFKYIFSAVIVGIILSWCIENIELFRAFKTWMRPEIYGPQGEATLLKTASYRIILSYFESPLNWLFGLGPGHTVGRLGGWMLEKYSNLLLPLGATIHPASSDAWRAVYSSWIGPASSMFSPLFGWAGIWGDIGLLGIVAYLYVWYIIWRRLCNDTFSKFLIINVFVHGFIFTQMEEPGYMLVIVILIVLPWHEQRMKSANSNLKCIT